MRLKGAAAAADELEIKELKIDRPSEEFKDPSERIPGHEEEPNI